MEYSFVDSNISKVNAKILYDRFVKFVQMGIFEYEVHANRLVEIFGFPKTPLLNALQTAHESTFDRYLRLIKRGMLGWGEDARRLIERYGYSTTALQYALAQGEHRKKTIEEAEREEAKRKAAGLAPQEEAAQDYV